MKFKNFNNMDGKMTMDKVTKQVILVEDSEEAIIEIGSNGTYD